MALVKFKVESTGTSYRFWVDGHAVPISNKKGEADLVPGTHFLVWFATGAPGPTITITIDTGTGDPVVIEGTIPTGYGHAAGSFDFEVGA